MITLICPPGPPPAAGLENLMTPPCWGRLLLAMCRGRLVATPPVLVARLGSTAALGGRLPALGAGGAVAGVCRVARSTWPPLACSPGVEGSRARLSPPRNPVAAVVEESRVRVCPPAPAADMVGRRAKVWPPAAPTDVVGSRARLWPPTGVVGNRARVLVGRSKGSLTILGPGTWRAGEGLRMGEQRRHWSQWQQL